MPSTSQMRAMWPEFVKSTNPLICDFSSATTVRFPAGGNFGNTVGLKVHPDAAEAFQALAQTFFVFGYFFWDPAGGTCVCRPISGRVKTSLHAHGVALDINPSTNRYRWHVGPIKWGVHTDMPKEMIRAVEGIRTKGGFRVFEWGGRWRNVKDPMHFQPSKCTRAQLVRGIDWWTVPPGFEEEDMRRGDRGVDVEKLQNYLNRWIVRADIVHDELVEDGDFGLLTEELVRVFQGWARLEVTGVVNPISMSTLTALVVS